MNFFKPIYPAPKAKPALLNFLSPFAAAALEENVTVWRTLDMLRTASIFLLFEEWELVYVRRGFGRYARLSPRLGTPPGDLLWHLLGRPGSVDSHDRAMRILAAHLAWYQADKFRTQTPNEVIEVVENDGQSVAPSVIYEIVEDDFAGLRRGEHFEDMVRCFRFSIAHPDYIRSWGTQRRAIQ